MKFQVKLRESIKTQANLTWKKTSKAYLTQFGISLSLLPKVIFYLCSTLLFGVNEVIRVFFFYHIYRVLGQVEGVSHSPKWRKINIFLKITVWVVLIDPKSIQYYLSNFLRPERSWINYGSIQLSSDQTDKFGLI